MCRKASTTSSAANAGRAAGAARRSSNSASTSRKQPAGQLRALRHQLIGIDAEIADVVAERAQTDARVLVEIALAQFEEATKGLQHAEVAVDRLAGQRVQDHVDSLATGDSEDLIGRTKAARVENVLDAQQTQKVALLIGAGRGEDLRPAPLGDLDRGDADAAGGAVNQDCLARLQTAPGDATRNRR